MNLLNEDYFKELMEHKKEFLNTKPFPFLNKKGIFKAGMREKLLEETPVIPEQLGVSGTNLNTGTEQICFIRYHTHGLGNIALDLNDVWKSFIEDFKSKLYSDFCREIYDLEGEFSFHVQWAYSSNFANIGNLPHQDAAFKKGTNLFYLSKDWDPAWGGRTGIVGNYIGRENVTDRYDPTTWGDIAYAEMENECILFKVSECSWHFIEPLNHPNPEVLNRKIFFINAVQFTDTREKCPE